jgi:hypothetical protein
MPELVLAWLHVWALSGGAVDLAPTGAVGVAVAHSSAGSAPPVPCPLLLPLVRVVHLPGIDRTYGPTVIEDDD